MTARNLSVHTLTWKAKWAVFKIQGFVYKHFLPSFPSPSPSFTRSIFCAVSLCSQTPQKRLLRRLVIHKKTILWLTGTSHSRNQVSKWFLTYCNMDTIYFCCSFCYSLILQQSIAHYAVKARAYIWLFLFIQICVSLGKCYLVQLTHWGIYLPVVNFNFYNNVKKTEKTITKNQTINLL